MDTVVVGTALSHPVLFLLPHVFAGVSAIAACVSAILVWRTSKRVEEQWRAERLSDMYGEWRKVILKANDEFENSILKALTDGGELHSIVYIYRSAIRNIRSTTLIDMKQLRSKLIREIEDCEDNVAKAAGSADVPGETIKVMLRSHKSRVMAIIDDHNPSIGRPDNERRKTSSPKTSE